MANEGNNDFTQAIAALTVQMENLTRRLEASNELTNGLNRRLVDVEGTVNTNAALAPRGRSLERDREPRRELSRARRFEPRQ